MIEIKILIVVVILLGLAYMSRSSLDNSGGGSYNPKPCKKGKRPSVTPHAFKKTN